MAEDRDEKWTYSKAGVDIEAGKALAARIAELARTTATPEVLSGVGPFAALFHFDRYRDPVLVASADGVGTKLNLAVLMGRYDTVGIDLVNHCVNDILTAGAEPLFFLDYIAAADLGENEKVALVGGMASACRDVGCALIGGETADMPDVYRPGAFDLVGFIVGVVERDRVINGAAIKDGDAILGIASNGLHTNGYSLARRVFRIGTGDDPESERKRLYRTYPELGLTLGEALLVPHRSYYHEVRPLLPHLRGIAHITGGGLIDNVPRILPEGLAALFRRGSWPVPPIFTLIQRHGNVAEDEMYRVFNMGLGMVLVCAPGDVDEVKRLLPEVMLVGQVSRQSGPQRVIFS